VRVSLAIACVALIGCREDTLARVRREGAIRIGYSVEAPYAFVTPAGRVTGVDPELARLVAARLGLGPVRFRQTRFGGLLDDLDAGLVDAVATGLFVTPERERRVRFASPTAEVRASLLVAAGNPLGLTGYPALVAHPTARVAVLDGAVEGALLRRLGVPDARLVEVPDEQAGAAAVAHGLADALALSAPSLRWLVRAHPGDGVEEVRDVVQPPGPEYPARFAVAVRRDDAALAAAWSAALAAVAETPARAQLLEQFGFAGEPAR